MHEQLKYNLSFSIKSKQSYFLKKSKIILLQTARTKLDLNMSPAVVLFMKVWPAYKQLLLFKAKVTLIIINRNINLYCGTCS